MPFLASMLVTVPLIFSGAAELGTAAYGVSVFICAGACPLQPIVAATRAATTANPIHVLFIVAS